MTNDNRGAARRRCCCGAAKTNSTLRYHDREWGLPSSTTETFEFASKLPVAAGLPRSCAAKAFAGLANFEFERVAKSTARNVDRLREQPGDRPPSRQDEPINNKRAEPREFGSLAAYFWRFEPGPTSRPARITREVLASMPTSIESVAMSKDLKKRGWSFVGPTTIYAFMQAMGLVNDHVHACFVHADVVRARAKFKPPR